MAHFVSTNICTLKGNLMSEDAIMGAITTPKHPRAVTYKDLIDLFVSHKICSLCRFVQAGGWFDIELTTKEKLFSWNILHGGYFRRFSTDFSLWRNRDYDDFSQLLRSPEFYVEICSGNIRIYKHRDFSV